MIQVDTSTHVVVFDKFCYCRAESDAAKHALAFSNQRLLALLVLDVHIKGITLEEELQVSVMLQHRMGSGFVQHALQRLPPRLHKACIKPSDCLLFWRRWNDNARVIIVQLIVQPKEIAETT
jgi:hypothetical protein